MAEDNPIQNEVNALAKYAEDHKMKINRNETKILPEVKLDDDNLIEVVEKTKQQGIIVKNELKWHSNTKKTLAKCCTNMWLLRNLQKIEPLNSDD